MFGWLAPIVERTPFLSWLNYGKGQVLYRLGLRRHHSGATHTGFGFTIDQSVDYIRGCGRDYIRYAGIEEGDLHGKAILEVGPGDNLGVALYFLAKGARRVACVEAFDPIVDERRNVLIYRRLLESFGPAERARAEQAIRIVDERTVEFAPRLLHCHYRTRIEDAPRRLAGETFDIVLSRAVLEHVADVERGWAAMAELLEPPGAMWHKVDFKNHGYFEQLHPLYFLTCRDRYWGLISAPDPTLNRRRIDTYRRLAAEVFRESKVYLTHVLQGKEILPHVERLVPGVHYGERELELIRQIRPRLVSPFREMTDEELLVSGIFVICHGLRRGARGETGISPGLSASASASARGAR
jgi:SAM-dependent methyltransferase